MSENLITLGLPVETQILNNVWLLAEFGQVLIEIIPEHNWQWWMKTDKVPIKGPIDLGKEAI